MGFAMLSVLIETKNDEDALARTLSSLVSAAVQGVVREVIVCDGGSSDSTQKVAEHAGCHFLNVATAGAGARSAKSEWLLLLEPGAKLIDGWTEAAAIHVETGSGAARFSRSRHAQTSFLERLFGRSRALSDGLIIPRSDALSGAKDCSAEAIAKSVSSRKLMAKIVPAQRQKP